MKSRCLVILALLALVPLARATERGVMMRAAQIYLQPDTASARIATIECGRELAVLEHSRDWIHVLATLSENPETGGSRDVTGWMLDKGVVRAHTPDGDRILYGQAASLEAEASRRGGRKGAAQDAMRLYARTAEYFPQSPLAGEALYRAADIRWQIDRADVMSRASARRTDPRDRLYGMDDRGMKQVIKKFPHTKWADLAAFHLIENKLCGDWQGLAECPEKESELYEKYADEHPQSPTAAEALYDAAWRRAALIELYKTAGKANKSPDAKARAAALARRVISSYPQTDWAARAQTLLYMMDQGIPTYGNATE
jgi:outer membrane protein assembly factor BamD (BamD/ComL family)